MNKNELIKKCLISVDSAETYPFKKEEYSGTVVMRHKSNLKWYALIFEQEGKLCLNVKAPPDVIAVVKEQYPSISAAWHMNKKHWCKADVNSTPDGVLEELIKISFELTAPKTKSIKKRS